MASLVVIRPGIQTTVQDLGRWGHQSSGVPVAGAMDRTAHRRANLLVGNPPSAATLEVTMTGPELLFEDDRAVGVAGAEFELDAGGGAVHHGSTLRMSRGGRLAFGARVAGARAYVAVSGGFDVPLVLGSRSTHLPSGIGGFEGRALRAGDRVPLGRLPVDGGLAPNVVVSIGASAGVGARRHVLRIVRGADLEGAGDERFDRLVASEYHVSPSSNRMGLRLEGPRIPSRTRADRLSDATPLGTIQLPPSGQPILLMADRPTTGGYPAIACVITADIEVAAQLAPGDAVSFAASSLEDARDAAFAREMELRHSEDHK